MRQGSKALKCHAVMLVRLYHILSYVKMIMFNPGTCFHVYTQKWSFVMLLYCNIMLEGQWEDGQISNRQSHQQGSQQIEIQYFFLMSLILVFSFTHMNEYLSSSSAILGNVPCLSNLTLKYEANQINYSIKYYSIPSISLLCITKFT